MMIVYIRSETVKTVFIHVSFIDTKRQIIHLKLLCNSNEILATIFILSKFLNLYQYKQIMNSHFTNIPIYCVLDDYDFIHFFEKIEISDKIFTLNLKKDIGNNYQIVTNFNLPRNLFLEEPYSNIQNLNLRQILKYHHIQIKKIPYFLHLININNMALNPFVSDILVKNKNLTDNFLVFNALTKIYVNKDFPIVSGNVSIFRPNNIIHTTIIGLKDLILQELFWEKKYIFFLLNMLHLQYKIFQLNQNSINDLETWPKPFLNFPFQKKLITSFLFGKWSYFINLYWHTLIIKQNIKTNKYILSFYHFLKTNLYRSGIIASYKYEGSYDKFHKFLLYLKEIKKPLKIIWKGTLIRINPHSPIFHLMLNTSQMKNPLYHYDFNNMYGHILATTAFPYHNSNQLYQLDYIQSTNRADYSTAYLCVKLKHSITHIHQFLNSATKKFQFPHLYIPFFSIKHQKKVYPILFNEIECWINTTEYDYMIQCGYDIKILFGYNFPNPVQKIGQHFANSFLQFIYPKHIPISLNPQLKQIFDHIFNSTIPTSTFLYPYTFKTFFEQFIFNPNSTPFKEYFDLNLNSTLELEKFFEKFDSNFQNFFDSNSNSNSQSHLNSQSHSTPNINSESNINSQSHSTPNINSQSNLNSESNINSQSNLNSESNINSESNRINNEIIEFSNYHNNILAATAKAFINITIGTFAKNIEHKGIIENVIKNKELDELNESNKKHFNANILQSQDLDIAIFLLTEVQIKLHKLMMEILKEKHEIHSVYVDSIITSAKLNIPPIKVPGELKLETPENQHIAYIKTLSPGQYFYLNSPETLTEDTEFKAVVKHAGFKDIPCIEDYFFIKKNKNEL